VRTDPLVVGNIHWLVAISPRRPLVGSVTADSWWLTLLIGLLGSLLLAAVVETSRRRRDAALALYASEHHLAETLQRSLLPQIPELPGLDIAARYLAGGMGQEVGGDWFDVFLVAGGAVAVTVGDVIGHDIAAASAMAQIRSVVRAYAVEGEEPKHVINRLDRLVQALGLTQLATVVFGLLSPPAADGSRTFTFTNAGHPAPLLRQADGQVEPLLGADPVLIGAPMTVDHMQTVRRLEHGSTLLLFTDGLVEDPARSLDETTADVAACLAEQGAGTDVEALCDRLLDTAAARELRDDVAVLVIRIGGAA
jgi:serine phosphatase RsbU (regulator of sigma subunit)